MLISGLMDSKSKFQFSCPRSSRGREEHGFAFQFWYSESSFNNQWGRDRRPDFVIFVVWSALIVDGWVVMAWSKKSCLGPAAILSFCFWCKSRERKFSVQESEFKGFFCVGPGMERFSLDLLRAVKKMCFRSGMWGCVEFVVAGWSKVNFFLFFNLKLG